MPLSINGKEDNCNCNISEIDLRIILNNFLLNSSEFLEKATVEEILANEKFWSQDLSFLADEVKKYANS